MSTPTLVIVAHLGDRCSIDIQQLDQLVSEIYCIIRLKKLHNKMLEKLMIMLHEPFRLLYYIYIYIYIYLLPSCCSSQTYSQTPFIHLPNTSHFCLFRHLFFWAFFLRGPITPFHSISTLIAAWSLSITYPKSSILASQLSSCLFHPYTHSPVSSSLLCTM